MAPRDHRLDVRPSNRDKTLMPELLFSFFITAKLKAYNGRNKIIVKTILLRLSLEFA